MTRISKTHRAITAYLTFMSVESQKASRKMWE